ncbi:MAG: division/cell wall cluster transcriptional repressor MraZ [Armatimonadota bacterium]
MTGTHFYNLDRKGRVVIPAPFRAELGEPIILARAPNRTVVAMPRDRWETAAAKRDGELFRNFFLSGAVEVRPDAFTGRVQIPHALRQHMALRFPQEVTVAGVGAAAVLCERGRWDAHLRELETRLVAFLLG